MPRILFDPATDYYQLLGVRASASTDEIQAAYRRLAKAYHPDLNAGSATAAARMARVNVAKSVLLDPVAREAYDHSRAVRRRMSGHAAPRGPSPVSAQQAPPAGQTTVRYAPSANGHSARPRYRVVPASPGRSTSRVSFDRHTGVLLLLVLPMAAALVMYLVQAVQLAGEPLRAPPSDLALAPSSGPGRVTARGTADAVFQMVHTESPSPDVARRANNLILSRTDSSPESELLRADGRRLVRSANAGDTASWEAAVADVCRLAGRC